jgi:hypothetical protein
MKLLTTRQERKIRMEYAPRPVSRRALVLFPIIITVVSGLLVSADQTRTIIVPGTSAWTDSGIDVFQGQEVKFEAEGKISLQTCREIGIHRFKGKLFIMLSSGGVTSVETAAEFPVRIIESGPTAAVIAGQYYGKLFNISEMFCFDMGGTTAKSCLIQKGVAGVVPTFEVGRVQRFMKGSGLTIQVPVVDLMEIGAGGGSIAKVSRMGTLQVGPESSGAEPGPICYGIGGTDPCVTDADLLLGYLDENYFLGGEMKLDKEAARRGVDEKIAKPLGVPFIQATWGIHDLINETMAAAAKTHIAEKGGMALLISHPDYMNLEKKESKGDEYPIGFYQEFLSRASSVVGIGVRGQAIKAFLDGLSCSNAGKHGYFRVLRAFYKLVILAQIGYEA